MSDVVRVRLLFVDDGQYHQEDVPIPESALEGYDRLIDCIREEPEVLKRVFVDADRLCSAYLVGGWEG